MTTSDLQFLAELRVAIDVRVRDCANRFHKQPSIFVTINKPAFDAMMMYFFIEEWYADQMPVYRSVICQRCVKMYLRENDDPLPSFKIVVVEPGP